MLLNVTNEAVTLKKGSSLGKLYNSEASVLAEVERLYGFDQVLKYLTKTIYANVELYEEGPVYICHQISRPYQ